MPKHQVPIDETKSEAVFNFLLRNPEIKSQILSIIDQHKIFGYTILHAAVVLNNVPLIQLLLNCPDININAWSGVTPLHLAVNNGLTEIVRMLVDAGADQDILDTNEMTPFALAEIIGNQEILEVFGGAVVQEGDLVDENQDIQGELLHLTVAISMSGVFCPDC